MAFIEHAINVADLPKDEMQSFDPLPDGEYRTRIEKCELKNTKAGDGEYFNFQLKVVGEKFAGRVLFGTVTRKNPSEKAEQIGAGQLRTIMESCGISSLSDTDQFIGGEVFVRIGSKEYNGKTTNEVKGWKAVDGAGVGAVFGTNPAAPATTAPAPAKSDKRAPPWASKKS